MAKAILGADYGTVVFTPGSGGAGTVVFSNVQGFSPSDVLAVLNETRGVIIYNPASTTANGTWSAISSTGGTLTLALNTTGYSGGDVLLPIHNTGGSQSSNSNGWTAENVKIKSDEGNAVDDDAPKTSDVLPTEAYGMLLNDATQKWDRARGDKINGQGHNLMGDGGGYMQSIAYYLAIIARAAPFLSATGNVPFELKVNSAGNLAGNVMQLNGQTITTGPGPSSPNGNQRVALSQDSFYPLPPSQVSQYISCT